MTQLVASAVVDAMNDAKERVSGSEQKKDWDRECCHSNTITSIITCVCVAGTTLLSFRIVELVFQEIIVVL